MFIGFIPPGMYETLQIMGYLPYQVVQDLSHQPYHSNSGRAGKAARRSSEEARAKQSQASGGLPFLPMEKSQKISNS